jgi:MFS family permease
VPLVAAVALWCPRDKPHEESNRDSLRTKARAFWGMRRSVGLLFVAATLVMAANTGLFFLFPELLASKGYAGWVVNGGAFAFLVMGLSVGVLAGGHLAERHGMRAILLLSVAVNFAVFEAFVQVGTLPVPLFLAVCVLAGACMGLVQPLPVALGQALEPRNASLVSGLLMGWTWVLGSFSPLVVAFLARELGTSDALSLYGLLNLAALGCTMALVRGLPSLTDSAGPAGAA